VQFLAVNIPDLTAGGNMSVLAPRLPGGDSRLPGWVYTLAMLIDEYHIGMLIPQGDGQSACFYGISIMA
jgi:hypothetical protein